VSPALILGLVVVVLALGAFVKVTDRRPAHALPDQIQARFQRDFPDATVEAIQRTDDGQAALLWLGEDAPIGLVLARGDHALTRVLGGGMLCSAEVLPAGLRLRTRDFTLPWVDLPLADEAARTLWAERLQARIAEDARGHA